ncbi:MAG: serine O-acetyltransferase [Paracoccaceae bacterium]
MLISQIVVWGRGESGMRNMIEDGVPHSQREPVVSATVPDHSREVPRGRWDPSRHLLRAIRDYQAVRHSSGVMAVLRRKYAVMRHRVWSVVTGAEIDLKTTIGGGLVLPHPNGIVIHPDTVIGPNCLIFQQVTVGVTTHGGPPVIAGHVDIGAGAKILGPITIGDHAVIGANAVVTKDVPAWGKAVGVPATITLRSDAPDP